jgi:hypothetical protein
MLAQLQNSDAPLGSVELVTSPGGRYVRPTDNVAIEIETATRKNVQAAFDRWFQRCDSHADNVGVFYFCGHGILKENLVLLAQDFGESANRLFENSFDFHKSYRGMAQCKAKVQCFFIDSCMQVPFDVLEYLTIDATPLISPRVRGNPREAAILYATSPEGRAYALANEETRFTQALLRCLSEWGGKHVNGRWIVTPSSLASAVKKVVGRMSNLPGVPHQICTSDGDLSDAMIHMLASHPTLPVTVGCAPAEANQFAQLSAVSIANPALQYQRNPQPDDWELELKSDQYTVVAEFPTPGLGYIAQREELWALQPFDRVDLKVTQ